MVYSLSGNPRDIVSWIHIASACVSLDLLEAGASWVFPEDEVSGGSAFCYFGPAQKFRSAVQALDWDERAFFAGTETKMDPERLQGWAEGSEMA